MNRLMIVLGAMMLGLMFGAVAPQHIIKTKVDGSYTPSPIIDKKTAPSDD